MENFQVEYLDYNISRYTVDFRVTGVYNREEVNEVVRITLSDWYSYKIASKKNPIETNLDFLRMAKYTKDNLANSKIKKMFIELALKSHEIHKREIEELKLTLELSNYCPEQTSFSTPECLIYDRFGRIHYLA